MVYRSHSLTNRSSRRRRVTVYLQQKSIGQDSVQIEPLVDSENEIVSDSRSSHREISTVPSEVELSSRSQNFHVSSSSSFTESEGLQQNSASMSAMASLLHDKVSQQASVTWVFAGDANFCTTHDSLQAFPRLFEDYARKHLRRESDIFVNATFPGARLEHVRNRVELRFRQLEPSVVVLHCGFAECLSGVEKCSEFEQAMISLIEEVHQAGAIPIVCTPPHSDVDANSPEEIDRLIFLEAIRGSAVEHNAVLVDFWSDWERKPSEVLNYYWDKNRKRPTIKGLERMERHLINELQLSPLQESQQPQHRATSTQPQMVKPN